MTVIRTLQRLEDQGLIYSTHLKDTGLTKSGKQLTERAATKHELLKGFFVVLGASEHHADADTKSAEHHFQSRDFERDTHLPRSLSEVFGAERLGSPTTDRGRASTLG